MFKINNIISKIDKIELLLNIKDNSIKPYSNIDSVILEINKLSQFTPNYNIDNNTLEYQILQIEKNIICNKRNMNENFLEIMNKLNTYSIEDKKKSAIKIKAMLLNLVINNNIKSKLNTLLSLLHLCTFKTPN
jgi:hypothetical protein